MVNIEAYIYIYNTGVPISSIRYKTNQTYRVFSQSKVPIRIVGRKSTYKNALAFKKIKSFLQNNEFFYMIPITTPKGTIVGFILRGVFGKSYTIVSRDFNTDKKVPLMFGFDSSFKDYDKNSECLPIVVCEGCKDCMIIKTFYPYAVSVNTSSMGINMEILRNISNKFILAYDNDTAGQEGIKRDKYRLRQTGAFVDSIKLPEDVKDCADCFDNLKNYDKLKEQVLNCARALKNFGS